MGEAVELSIEQMVIDQLHGYKRIVARMKILEKYPIGNGMYLSAIQGDDRLQALHRQLRGLPSYMYLTQRELKLEGTAIAYLRKYPAGTKSQLNEIRQQQGLDDEDQKLLRELEVKIQKVIEARCGIVDGYDAVIERLSEMQDLEQEMSGIDRALDALAEYKPQYAALLRLRYIEDKPVDEVLDLLKTAKRTYERWRPKAIEEYAGIVGILPIGGKLAE
jgi:tetratricopeptide (TPR) repeat protein